MRIITIIAIIWNYYPNGGDWGDTQNLRLPTGAKMSTAGSLLLEAGTSPWSMHICEVQSWTSLAHRVSKGQQVSGLERPSCFFFIVLKISQLSIKGNEQSGGITAMRRNGDTVSKCWQGRYKRKEYISVKHLSVRLSVFLTSSDGWTFFF